MQFLKYILFIDVLYPKNVYRYFQYLAIFDLENLPFLPRIVPLDKFKMYTHNGFHRMDVDALYMHNSNLYMLAMPILIIAHVILYFVNRYYSTKPASYMKHIISKVYTVFEWNLWISLIFTEFLNLNTFALLQLQNSSVENWI